MPEQLEDEFGDIIKKARAGKGYMTDELAHLAGMSAGDLQDMETYKLKPSNEQVMTLARILNLNGEKLAAIADDSWHPVERDLGVLGRALVERIKVPYIHYSSNSYILGSIGTGEAAVIDPGGAVEQILDALKKHDLKVVYILITHGHGDHTGGLSALMRSFPSASIVVGSAEKVHGPDVTHPEGGEELELGDLKIRALMTPGHTQGSICYYVASPGLCFVGDTLFAGSIGGTSGDREAFGREIESIRSQIFTLPSETILLPGHGPVTTVAEEKGHNPFF